MGATLNLALVLFSCAVLYYVSVRCVVFYYVVLYYVTYTLLCYFMLCYFIFQDYLKLFLLC